MALVMPAAGDPVLVGPLLLAAPVLGSLVFAWLSIGSTLAW